MSQIWTSYGKLKQPNALAKARGNQLEKENHLWQSVYA